MKLSKLLKNHLAKQEAKKEFEQQDLKLRDGDIELRYHNIKGREVLKLWELWDKLLKLENDNGK